MYNSMAMISVSHLKEVHSVIFIITPMVISWFCGQVMPLKKKSPEYKMHFGGPSGLYT